MLGTMWWSMSTRRETYVLPNFNKNKNKNAYTANRISLDTLIFKKILSSILPTSTPIPRIQESCQARPLVSLRPPQLEVVPLNATSGHCPSMRNSSTLIPARFYQDAGLRCIHEQISWMFWKVTLISMGLFGLRPPWSSYSSWEAQ